MKHWRAIILPKDCPPAYISPYDTIVWQSAQAALFMTFDEALNTAKRLAFAGELYYAECTEKGENGEVLYILP